MELVLFQTRVALLALLCCGPVFYTIFVYVTCRRCLELLLGSLPAEVAARLRAAAEDSIRHTATSSQQGQIPAAADLAMKSAQQQGGLAVHRMLPVKLLPFKLEVSSSDASCTFNQTCAHAGSVKLSASCFEHSPS